MAHPPNERFSVRASLRDRHVLVTGVTGFLGKVWLGMLLEHVPDVGHVTVLIRGKNGDAARDRFERIVGSSPALRPLREKHGIGLWDLLDDKVTVLPGNCAEAHCGLDPSALRWIGRHVDAVVHFAGLTDFMPDPADALSANVRGALHAADVASCSRGKRLLHVSTTFVAGDVSSEVPETLRTGLAPSGVSFDPKEELAHLERLCAETPGRRKRTDAAAEHARELGWPNLYTYSKALAEQLLAQRNDIRLTVARPAIVECARNYPFTGWNEGINTSGPLVWLFSTTFRHFPSRPRNHFDVVPVDTVARGTMLITAAAMRDEAEPVYQLGSSDTNPMTFGRAIDLTNLGVRRMHGRTDAPKLDRWIRRNLDVVPVDVGRDPLTGPSSINRLARRARDLLGRANLERDLPADLYERWGPKLESRIGKMSRSLRKTERNMKLVEQMLEMYQPFIHDNDYVFRTDRIRALSSRLQDDERDLFAFDAESLDWHHYWLEVEMPGLEKWTLPELRGEKVPQDPMLPRPTERANERTDPELGSDVDSEYDQDAAVQDGAPTVMQP
jgi:long-chain acyl-CoA synthetase